MARFIPSLVLSMTLAASPLVFSAETTPPTANVPASPAIVVPPILAPSAGAEKSAPPAPPRDRPVSPGVASILAARMPKYDPEVAKAAAEKKANEQSSLAESEKPQNDIVRLPSLIVRDYRIPIFTERAIYTKAGLADVAYTRYIYSEVDRALNRFTLPLFGFSARQRAMMMYADDERLRNMAYAHDAARIVSLTDAEGGMYIKKVANETYMRKSDFGWNGGRAANSKP